MPKDPAFLFYSKDFYEGTRTMLPEERACYVDLMIYQHQNGYIPKDDIKRVLLYCNGIKKATLEATLKAKFTLTEKGWVNSKLSDIVQEREEYSQKQSLNGQIGQFWKKMKAFLSKKSYDQLRDTLYGLSNEEVYNIIKDKEINKTNAQAMLEAVLKHLANADANANIIIGSIGGVGEISEPPKIHIREQIFTSECNSFLGKYSEETIKEFILYWTEPNKSQTKMRFEKEATWDTSRRLAIWENNKKTNFGRNNGKPNGKTRHGKVSFVPGKLQGSSTL